MPAGRPLELTPAIIAQVKLILPRAMYFETVAASIGIHPETFRRWLRAGAKEHRRRESGKGAEPKHDLHCELSGVVKKGLADAEIDHLEQIQAAGTDPKAWTALAWILERRFPERWATNRGELRALAKEIAALGKQGASGGTARPTKAKTKATPKEGR
jgi:hypothetical protein